MAADWLGWGGLTPDAQFGAICGGVGGLGILMAGRALFGGLRLKRAEARKRKAKAKRKTARAKGRR